MTEFNQIGLWIAEHWAWVATAASTLFVLGMTALAAWVDSDRKADH